MASQTVIDEAVSQLITSHRDELYDVQAMFLGVNGLLVGGESVQRLQRLALDKLDSAIDALDHFELVTSRETDHG